MSNNRLYIVDTESNEKFLLCKSMAAGWYPWCRTNFKDRTEELERWLNGRDKSVAYGGNGSSMLVLRTEDEVGC